MQEAVIIEKVGKKDFVAINLEFTNKNLAKNLPELYLYYKLRVWSAPTAGWIKDFVYTKNEKYNILPNLIKLGWISADGKKVNKYRDVVANCGCKSRVAADITTYELCDIETFKGYVIAINEKYLLDKKDRINKRIKTSLAKCKPIPSSWTKLKGATQIELVTKKTKEDVVVTITGRAFNDELSRLMGLSVSTITRWRAISNNNSFNSYELRSIRVNTDHKSKATKMVVEDRQSKGSVFSAKRDGTIIMTKDLLITSGIKLFYGTSLSIKKEKRKNLINQIIAKNNVELVQKRN